MKKAKYSEIDKKHALEQIAEGVPIKDVAKELGCSLGALRQWRMSSKPEPKRHSRLLAPASVNGAPDPRISELSREVLSLRKQLTEAWEKIERYQILEGLGD